MTWHAPRGDTVLTGTEAKLFHDVLRDICHEICNVPADENLEIAGAPGIYNRMTRTQQAASMHQVATALLTPTKQCLPLTAWSEATLAAIFSMMQLGLQNELDADNQQDVRRALAEQTEAEVLPGPSTWCDPQTWDLAFTCYMDQFLWDMDFESDLHADLPPETARAIGAELGVDDAYHASIPPDLRHDNDLAATCKAIVDLLPHTPPS